MIKPQKESKSREFRIILLTIIMIIGCFTTACQPTPEGLIVQNKADDDLKNAIEQTAVPTEQPSEQVQPAETAKPQIIVEDISSNASNTVHVNINAEVINNQPENISVAKITPKEFTEDEIKQMMQAFFGNTQLYSGDYTKEDYDEWILSKQLELNDEEKLKVYADDRNIEDLSEARNKLQEVIERLKRERQDAPDERAEADFSELYSEHGFDLLIDTGKGFMGNVKAGKDSALLTAFNDDNNYYMQRSLSHLEHIDSGCVENEFVNAKQMAIMLIEDMGIDGVAFGDAYISKDYTFSNNDEPHWNGREYYVFCFDAVVGGSVIDGNKSWVTPPALEDMSGKDGYEDVAPVHYDKMIPYERMEVWVEGDEIVQFKHRYPIEVTEIVNDNVAIAIDYPEAIEFAKQFAYTAFIDPRENFLECKLDINRIELVLVRIKEKDTRGDIVVPVWSFCGSYSRKVNPKNKNTLAIADENGWITDQGIEGFGDVLITINALDGTVIDLVHGY
jgi:hypothetical protein